MNWFKNLFGRKSEPDFDGHDFIESAPGALGQSAYYTKPVEIDEQLVVYSIYAGYDSQRIGTLELREGGKEPRLYPINVDKTITFDPPLTLDWGNALQLQLTAGGTEKLPNGVERTIQSSITVHGCHVKQATEP